MRPLGYGTPTGPGRPTHRGPRLLLLSNGTGPDGYLAHVVAPARRIAAGARTAFFVPYAGVSRRWGAYARDVEEGLAPLGLSVRSAHDAADPLREIGTTDLIVVGGGNTFQLLSQCRARGLLGPLARAVRNGTPYVGWSAGANLAAPTLCTTNDMPIVDPGGFDALGLVGFQVNPHYPPSPLPPGSGEARVTRIREHLGVTPHLPVLALEDGAWVLGDGRDYEIGGTGGAWWHASGLPARWLPPGRLAADVPARAAAAKERDGAPTGS